MKSKNISFCGTCAKYSMVWVFSRFIDRISCLFPDALTFPIFFILVIDIGRA